MTQYLQSINANKVANRYHIPVNQDADLHIKTSGDVTTIWIVTPTPNNDPISVELYHGQMPSEQLIEKILTPYL